MVRIMNAPTRTQEYQVDSWSKMRIMIAGEVASGLAANPENMNQMSWETSIARSAVFVADQIIRIVLEGRS